MGEYSTDNWTAFKVGKPSTKKNWVEQSCQSLETVSHVTHIHHALNVLRDGQISPQLIYDKSRLNTERILVVWLSPNDWSNAGGFRYGNVAFELDWATLIAGKQLYWIGAMDYRPPACRVLVTDQNRAGQLSPYIATNGDGPWWHDVPSGRHYWNGHYCLELMLEMSIKVSAISSLRFVTHHDQRCSIDPKGCPDRGHDADRGAARFLVGALAHRLLDRHPSLWLKDEKTPTTSLTRAWNELRWLVTRKVDAWRGPIDPNDSAAESIARSVLAAISEWRKRDRRELVAMFRSAEDAVETCATLIETGLDLPNGTLDRSNDG